MKTNEEVKLDTYFTNRSVDPSYYNTYQIPRWLKANLPTDKNAKVLDIGCGYGQFLNALKQSGYNSLMGIDINNEAINECKSKGLKVEQIKDIRDFANSSNQKFDFIIMSHVLEHIDKDIIIDTLAHIKKHLLNDNGAFLLMVPNAQSYTGTYWRYEDFTHTIMFTGGSCIYVLKAAGFNTVEFLDPEGTQYISIWKKPILRLLIAIHKLKEDFWNTVLQTSFHKPSPRVYGFELKVLAR